MQFADLEKARFGSADVDESGLQARLDTEDDALVNVALDLFFAADFNVQLHQATVVDNCHTGFFRVHDVDQHFLAYWCTHLLITFQVGVAA